MGTADGNDEEKRKTRAFLVRVITPLMIASTLAVYLVVRNPIVLAPSTAVSTATVWVFRYYFRD